MLELLRIRDLALIEDLEIEFATGMNVLTGETGAGKSFILKAVNFLMGEKLTTDLVRPGKEKAVVEALFIVNGEERILRRELAAETGRSRFFINDQLSSQDVMREMRSSLIIHTSQHGQQKLLQPGFQAKILDDFMHRPELLEQKDTTLHALAELAHRREALERQTRTLEEKREIFEYQLHEIDKVSPKAGEEEELEAIREASRNQAGIAEAIAQGLSALRGGNELSGLFSDLAMLERSVISLSKLLDSVADAPEMLVDIRATLTDLEARLRRLASASAQNVDIDAIESRLYKLAQLKRKLKRPLDSIVSLQKEIEANLSFLDSCHLDHKNLAREEELLCNTLASTLQVLNPERKKSAMLLALALQSELKNLGFSEHVRVIFDFSPHPLHSTRTDCVEERARLLWQPNPGQPPQPLDRIASGGELSRFLLAIVSLMSRNSDDMPTLIFDEVDAGVGGITLNRVADSLAGLASFRQMLLITHWPQLAARATRHFVVQKDILDGQTYTHCRRLDQTAIVTELARMSGAE